MPSPPYDLQAQSSCVDQFRKVCDHHSSSPHALCSYCQSFDHDVNSSTYYDVFDESYARHNPVIKTTNAPHTHFVSEMREVVSCMRQTLVYLSLGLRLASMMIVSLPFP